MKPNTIMVQMGRFMVEVPRKYLVEPSPELKEAYLEVKKAIYNASDGLSEALVIPSDWTATLVAVSSLSNGFPVSHLPKNLQKGFDKAEAEENTS